MKRLVLLPMLVLASRPPVAAATTTRRPAPRPAADDRAATKAQLDLVSAGKLTVGTDNPAFPPWFGGGTPKGSTGSSTTRTRGKGYESAVAYAVADQLGFAKDEVAWTSCRSTSSFKPGPKDFDFDINQISVTTSATRRSTSATRTTTSTRRSSG